MNREQHTITISPSGEVQVTVSGIKGKGCIKATEDLEKSLGTKISDHVTREYHETEDTKASNQQ